MYAIQADIEKRMDAKTLKSLSNDNAAATTPDTEVIESVLRVANAIVDDALRGRYALPLADNFEVLTDIASTIAIAKLHERRSLGKMPESITESVRAAMALLSEYATGKKILNVPAATTRPPQIVFSSRTKVFTDDVLSRY